MIHVSTAYANCDQTHIDEVIYPSSIDPGHILATAEWMDQSMLDLITPQLLSNLPNTYTFSKRLAESYLNIYGKHLPIGM